MNFIPYNYKDVFGLLINLDWHFPAIQALFLLNSVALVAIKPMGAAKRTRIPATRTAIPYQSQQMLEEERSGTSWSPILS